MRFPKTYVDSLCESMVQFQADISSGTFTTASSADGTFLDTGTTVVALLSEDRKIGIIASDGRVTSGTSSFKEDFQKVFSCRTGFVGIAGALGALQIAIRNFKMDLDTICDSRRQLMTASGAAGRLFQYHAAMSRNPSMMGGFSGLFWDEAEKKCHLYLLEGASKLSMRKCAYLGSGSDPIKRELKKSPPTNSKEEMMEILRSVLRGAAEEDEATNNHLFFGIIDHGRFSEKEEVL